MVVCRCDCGSFVDVPPFRLRSGNTNSCGCKFSDVVAQRNKAAAKHNHASGRKVTAEYRAWASIKNRCLNENDKRYPDYGGRGIKVHPEWITSFEAFLRDVGSRPSRQFTIDRICNNGNYEPGNVRWATAAQQNRNRRTTKQYELAGELKPLAEWAELAGLPYDRVRQRVETFGWPLNEALGTPISGGGRMAIADRKPWI